MSPSRIGSGRRAEAKGGKPQRFGDFRDDQLFPGPSGDSFDHAAGENVPDVGVKELADFPAGRIDPQLPQPCQTLGDEIVADRPQQLDHRHVRRKAGCVTQDLAQSDVAPGGMHFRRLCYEKPVEGFVQGKLATLDQLENQGGCKGLGDRPDMPRRRESDRFLASLVPTSRYKNQRFAAAARHRGADGESSLFTGQSSESATKGILDHVGHDPKGPS